MRTDLGVEVIERMIADGAIEARPAQEDEKAMKLLRMSIVSRRRWPKDADPPLQLAFHRQRRKPQPRPQLRRVDQAPRQAESFTKTSRARFDHRLRRSSQLLF